MRRMAMRLPDLVRRVAMAVAMVGAGAVMLF
jgi:hypothetical protein